MKNDDEINESSISDLIHYAEDEKRNTFDDEPETDDELDDEITETDDETVSDKEEPVSEEVSEETKKNEEEPVSEEAEEEPEDELALEEADEENSSEEEKTLSNNVNYDDDTDYPDYETDVGFFDDLKIGDHKGIIIGVIIGIIVVICEKRRERNSSSFWILSEITKIIFQTIYLKYLKRVKQTKINYLTQHKNLTNNTTQK